MKTRGRPVTKSVRLSAEEYELVATVSEREHLPQGAFLRKLLLDGLAQYRLAHAVGAYTSGELNLGEAARRAGVTVARFLAELDRRGIDTITPAHFHAGLSNLVDVFGGSPELRETLASRAAVGSGDDQDAER